MGQLDQIQPSVCPGLTFTQMAVYRYVASFLAMGDQDALLACHQAINLTRHLVIFISSHQFILPTMHLAVMLAGCGATKCSAFKGYFQASSASNIYAYRIYQLPSGSQFCGWAVLHDKSTKI